jgi:hypothetical protein
MIAILLAAAVVEVAAADAAAPATPVRVVAITTRPVGAKQAVVIDASSDWGAVAIKRDGPEIVATLSAEADPALTVPSVVLPIKAIDLEPGPGPGELRLRVAVAPDVPYEVRRDGARITLLFGPVLSPAPSAGLELYRSLFPAQAETTPTEAAPEGSSSAPALPGIGFGPLRLQPSLILTYFDAEATINGPQPVRDQYFQIQPDLGMQLVLLNGYLRAAYEPHFRLRSDIPEVNAPSHDFDAGLQLPVGQRLSLALSDHYTITTLDTPRADPGREYFFDLGRFTRNDAGGYLEVELGPRLKARVRGSEARVRFSEEAGFFDYDLDELGGRMDFYLTEQSRLEIEYNHAHVPSPPERPIAESTTDSWLFGLEGELPALIRGKLAVGHESVEAPRAPQAGSSYGGVAATASLTKEIGRTVRVLVDGGRQSYVSAFEQNAFYVSSSINGLVEFPIALGIFGRAGAGYRRNSYQLDADGRNFPRVDDIFDWTLGAGRSLTRWTFLRADVVHDHRDSNLSEFDSRTRTFMIQLGITPFGTGTR